MFRRHHIDDAAIEAFFAGNEAEGELAPLAAFAEHLRAKTAMGPVPVPSAQLAAMLADGFSTEKGDLLVTAASNVTGPAPQAAGLPKWRKKKMIGEFIAGLSMATKATFGMSMAAASVTAAGATGALPEPAENAVAAAVEAVTPFSFSDEADDNADFGGRVSTDARDGGVDGREVSEDAKDNGDGTRPAEPGQTGLDRANETPAAGHVPTSVPSGRPETAGRPATTPAPAGSQSSTGTSTADETPAAGHTPEAVPGSPATADQYRPDGAGSQSSTGTSTADDTPAGSDERPAVPAGRP